LKEPRYGSAAERKKRTKHEKGEKEEYNLYYHPLFLFEARVAVFFFQIYVCIISSRLSVPFWFVVLVLVLVLVLVPFFSLVLGVLCWLWLLHAK
jgi:hypothetical protein